MRKYPFVHQEGNKDCGVSCLAMIIAYYGGHVPIEKLREESNTTEKGVTAYDLINCASHLGFHAKGWKGKQHDLDDIKQPFIAHILLEGNFGHYIVVYKNDKKKKQFLVGDPSSSLKKISYEEFSRMWDGVIITLYPYKKLPLYNQTFSMKKFVLFLIKEYKKELLNLIFLSSFITCFSILQSFFFEILINKIAYTQKKEPYFFVFYLFLGILLLKQGTNYLRNKLFLIVNTKMDYFLQEDIYRTLIYLPYRYYKTRTTGEITSKMNDLDELKSFLSDFLTTILVDFFLGIVCFIVLLVMNVKLAFLALGICIFVFLLCFLFQNGIHKKIQEVQVKRAITTSHMVESFQGFSTIKNMHEEEKNISSYLRKYRSYLKSYAKFYDLSLKEGTLKEVIRSVGINLLLLIGVFEILEGKISLGNLITIHLLTNYLMVPFESFYKMSFQYTEMKSTLTHIIELFYEEEKKKTLPCKVSFPLTIQDLSYEFSEGMKILKNIDLTLSAGEKIMLIGSSGGGKSTLMKVLLKYYPIERNKVKFHEIDLNDIEESEVNKFISYFSQEEILFTESLWYNLTLGKKIDAEEVLRVARICEVEEVANRSDLGYFAPLEENGFGLSGGEKQRIMLARTLLLNRPFLIVDEGMGEMDTNLERRILKRIFENWPNLTMILISHRTDNQDLFQRVIEIDDGEKRKDVMKNG